MCTSVEDLLEHENQDHNSIEPAPDPPAKPAHSSVLKGNPQEMELQQAQIEAIQNLDDDENVSHSVRIVYSEDGVVTETHGEISDLQDCK